MSESFNVNLILSSSGLVVLEKIFKYFSSINSIPYCDPFPSSGAMILPKLILYIVRKLSCKFELFWPSGSYEGDFLNIFFYGIFSAIKPMQV
jgi:hypothetical protein